VNQEHRRTGQEGGYLRDKKKNRGIGEYQGRPRGAQNESKKENLKRGAIKTGRKDASSRRGGQKKKQTGVEI